MGDIKSPSLLYAKGALFLCTGLLAATLLIVDRPTLQTVALVVITVWSFCRAYYFAFYVIEHYVDCQYRFAGLWDFARYVLAGRSRRSEK